MELLGLKVLPLVKNISATYASSILFGFDSMHRSCNFTENQTLGMINAAKKVLRKQNKEQNWVVEAIHENNTFDLVSDMGYEQLNVNRNDFRIIN